MDFSGNTAITSDFPLSVWARLMRRTLNRPDALSSVDYNGAFELRYAISSYLKSMRGMNVDPELIIIGAGTEHLYNMIVQLLGSKKIYAVENLSLIHILTGEHLPHKAVLCGDFFGGKYGLQIKRIKLKSSGNNKKCD